MGPSCKRRHRRSMTPTSVDVAVVVAIAARPEGVDVAVWTVDYARRSFCWFTPAAVPPVNDKEAQSTAHEIAAMVDDAIKETRWWRNATTTASQRGPEATAVFLAALSDVVELRTHWETSETLRDVSVLDTSALLSPALPSIDAETAIARLLSQPRALCSIRRKTTENLYKLCLAAIQEVLARNSAVFEQPERFNGSFRLSAHNSRTLKCMRFNPSAASMFAAPASLAQPQSIFGLISRACSTRRGKKCLQKWIDRPCADTAVLNERHDIVDAFVHLLKLSAERVDPDSTPLEQFARFFRHFQASESKLAVFGRSNDTLSSAEFAVKPSLSSFGDLVEWIRAAKDILDVEFLPEGTGVDQNHYFASLRRDVASLFPLCILVDRVIGRSSPNTVCLEGEEPEDAEEVFATAVTLRQLRSEIEQCKDEVSATVDQIAIALHLQRSRIRVLYDDDDHSSFPTAGIVLRISRQDGHRIHHQNGKLVTIFKASKATGVWFTSPSIDLLGARWKALKTSSDAAEHELARLIDSSFQLEYKAVLSRAIRAISELDVLMAFALVSSSHGFVRASLADSAAAGDHASLEIESPFSPFVSEKRGGQDWSVRLSNTRRFLLLEGEETTDDTPLLHLIGTIVVLNQIGCFVPCTRATLPLLDAVLLRGGAYDQQLYGFSTFMTEMKEVALILEHISSNSLVLMDDLCRGTASDEGLALALALCSHLIERGALVCFSSLWRELTSQIEALDGVALPESRTDMASVPTSEQRRQDEDRRFHQLVVDSEAPRELMELIQQEMQLRTDEDEGLYYHQ